MHRPIIVVFLSFIMGILAGSYFTFDLYIILVCSAFMLLLLFISFMKRWFFTGFVSLFCFIFLLGVFNIQKQYHSPNRAPTILNYTHQGKMAVEGVVIESPVSYQDKDVVIVRSVRVLKEDSYMQTTGNIRLVIPPALNFQYGDFIRFQSHLKTIQNFNNPGRFDYRRFMNLQGIFVSGFVSDRSDIILIRQATAGGLKRTLESFRNYLIKIIDKNSFSPEKDIIKAMILGNQNEISADIRDIFNKTGTAHILSISGLHIGMVAATFFLLFFLLLKSSAYMMLRFNTIKIAATASFFMALIYALIAGMGVTVMRATLMAFIFLMALLSGKQRDFYNTLAIAGLIILFISPEALFDISFQLSFMSVLAIIYLAPRFNFFSLDKFSDSPPWMRSMIKYSYLSAIICLAATLGTLPLIIYYFDRVSLVTIIANMIAVPLLGTLALALAMFFILFSFSPVISGFFIQMATFLAQISITIIHKFAALPFSSLSMVKPNFFEIAMFYLLIVLITQFIDEKKKQSRGGMPSPVRLAALKYLSATIIVFFILDITYFALRDQFSSDLKITVLDVGQGNCTVIQLPGGTNMIIDGGGFAKGSFDVGKGIVAPFLYKKRINHIDTALLSHPHPDHLLGLIYIMNNFKVRQLWKNHLPVDAIAYPPWEETIRTHHVRVSLISSNIPEKIFNKVDVKILWPPENYFDGIHDLSYDAVNDSSVVLRITYGKISVLIPGDISAEIEKKLIQSNVDLKSDVLIAPHHGSSNSSRIEFINAVSCRYAVFSSGRYNVFKHPHPAIIQRYQEAGATILRTDQNGAISFTTNGDDLKVSTFMNSR